MKYLKKNSVSIFILLSILTKSRFAPVSDIVASGIWRCSEIQDWSYLEDGTTGICVQIENVPSLLMRWKYQIST